MPHYEIKLEAPPFIVEGNHYAVVKKDYGGVESVSFPASYQACCEVVRKLQRTHYRDRKAYLSIRYVGPPELAVKAAAGKQERKNNV